MSCCLYSMGWPGSMPKGPTAADSASWGVGGIFHKRLHLLKKCVAASHHGCSQVERSNSLHSRGLLVMCHLDTAPGLRTNLASTTLCLGTQPPSASFCSSRTSTPGRRTAQWVKDCCVSLTPECGSLEPTQSGDGTAALKADRQVPGASGQPV